MKIRSDKYAFRETIPIILFSVLCIIMSVFRFSAEIENFAEDFVYQRPSAIPDNIKIIAIDEATLEKLGPYFEWDRAYFAELINVLNESDSVRPEVIGLDIIFSGTGDADSDAALAEAAGKYGNVVTASKLDISERVVKNDGGGYYMESYVEAETTAYNALISVTEPGFTTPVFDSDGYIRRSYGTIISDGREYVSFAVKIARMYGVTVDEDIYEFLYSGTPGNFEMIPMIKVLDGSVPASYFKDCIVLVGACEDGLMDSYSVPIDHSRNMYGVEIQANQIAAIINGKFINTVSPIIQGIISIIIIFAVGMCLFRCSIRSGIIVTASAAALYPLLCSTVFTLTLQKLDILYIPVVLMLMFITALFLRYIDSQRKRNEEMQKMLFSMADSMAEAIEGRTPYNASHTKNVAKYCIEMLDHINELHKNKKTDMHFSDNDKKQLYLAAMLHDIGKMDVPTEVMDKPTRLGGKIYALRDRLEIIKLRIRLDEYSNDISCEDAQKECADIEAFLSQLDSFDCGRPLKEHELAFIDDLGSRFYRGKDNAEIPYITAEELEDLHIQAGTLSDSERKIMQSHVVFTDKILSHVDFGKEFDKVQRIAADHHEFINGKGYPNSKSGEQLDTMTRILTIVDIYDSLIADDRPYKKAKPVNIAFDILDQEAEAGKIDKELLKIAKEMWLKDDKAIPKN